MDDLSEAETPAEAAERLHWFDLSRAMPEIRPETSAGEFVLPLVTAVLRIPRT